MNNFSIFKNKVKGILKCSNAMTGTIKIYARLETVITYNVPLFLFSYLSLPFFFPFPFSSFVLYYFLSVKKKLV